MVIREVKECELQELSALHLFLSKRVLNYFYIFVIA